MAQPARRLIHEAGGHIIAEDESTCVVWGMPRSVFEAGVADEVLPLNQIASAISKRIAFVTLQVMKVMIMEENNLRKNKTEC